MKIHCFTWIDSVDDNKKCVDDDFSSTFFWKIIFGAYIISGCVSGTVVFLQWECGMCYRVFNLWLWLWFSQKIECVRWSTERFHPVFSMSCYNELLGPSCTYYWKRFVNTKPLSSDLPTPEWKYLCNSYLSLQLQ